jgi:hypothetical protein
MNNNITSIEGGDEMKRNEMNRKKIRKTTTKKYYWQTNQTFLK